MIIVMITRQLPAMNRQALLMTSIARMYCAFILRPSERACEIARAGLVRRPGRLPPRQRAASLHVLDALDQRGVLGPMLVPDRLDGILERLEVGDLVDLR